MASEQKRRLLTHLAALGAYAVASVALTWPLARLLSTHVPGSYTWAFDEYGYLWNTWWFRYSIFDLGQNPLYTTHIFFPLGTSLALHTYNLFNALISIPLQAFLSVPAISNLTFLLSTVLSGYGMFLLGEYLLRQTERRSEPPAAEWRAGAPSHGVRASPGVTELAAFASGLVFAFGSYRMIYASIGHYDKWSTVWLPFCALYLCRTIREPRMRNALLAGLFLTLSMLSEMVYGVFLAMLGLTLVLWAANRRNRRQVAGGLGALVRRLALLGLVAGLMYSVVLIPVLRDMAAGENVPGWGDAEKLSVDLLGFVTPTALHPLGGDWVQTLREVREGTARFRDVNTVFLGWTSLALAIVGAMAYRRRLAGWITSAVVFGLFCLGPLLQINGKSTFDLDGLAVNVPLPFILLHYMPIVQANRAPNRFSVILMLTLGVLVGFGVYWLLRKVAGSRSSTRAVSACLFVLLGSLILFEHWSVPLPMTDARIPAVYGQVASDPDDFAILQLPLGWRNSFGIQGAESTQTQFYQSYHHKRLLTGFVARTSNLNFDYFRRVPLLDSLITLETYGQVSPERRAADKSTAADVVRFYDLRYVVVAPGIPGRPPYVDTRGAAVEYLEQVLPVRKIYDREGWLLYEVDRPALPMSMGIDLGTGNPLEVMALGDGWAGAETIQGLSARWAMAQEARLFLPVSEGQDYRLTLSALPFDYPGAEVQQVTLSVNGRRMEPVALAPGWADYRWSIPGGSLHRGLNELRFRFSRLDAPAGVLPDDGVIGRTGIRAPVAIEINSGGESDFAYISVGDPESGLEDGSLHGPGYDVAVIHPRTGRLLDRRFFDTTPSGSEEQSSALAAFIRSIPDGQIVALAMQGDGATNLTGEAVAALRTLGGKADPRDIPGGSHALIGVKGAATGTALEAMGSGDSWLRAAPDRRTLGMAVDRLTWDAAGP